MKFNWKTFCWGGIAVSVLFGGMDYLAGNIVGAKMQLVLGLAYTAGLLHLSIKEHKND